MDIDEINPESSLNDPAPPYNPKLDLPDYKYPVKSLVSENFRSVLELLESDISLYEMPLLLGIGSQLLIKDIFHFPNILLGGTTGSGKTQFIYNQIASLLFRKHPSELKFILCGSKSIDYSIFEVLKYHFLASTTGQPAIVTPEYFLSTVNRLIDEVEERLLLFTSAKVKNVRDYNNQFRNRKLNPNDHHFMPDIVMFIDDLSNFVNSDVIIDRLTLLTQQNIYLGIYIIAVTSQISSLNISQQLKGNFIFRIGMKLMSRSDSRKILYNTGAELLMNPGEILLYSGGLPIKTQQPVIDYTDLQNIIDFIGSQRGYPNSFQLANREIIEEVSFDYDERDPLFDDAARLIVMHQQGSTSLIQRKLKLGYNRAGRVIDQLEAAGIVGPFDGSKAREVLIPNDYALEQYFQNQRSEPFKSSLMKNDAVLADLLSTGPDASNPDRVVKPVRINDEKSKVKDLAVEQTTKKSFIEQLKFILRI